MYAMMGYDVDGTMVDSFKENAIEVMIQNRIIEKKHVLRDNCNVVTKRRQGNVLVRSRFGLESVTRIAESY